MFRVVIGSTPAEDVLYTDITEVNEMGGFDQQSELRVTASSTDEYSQRCWSMTQAHRNQLRARNIADANGQPNVATVENVVPPTEADHPAEARPVLGSEANPVTAPYVATPSEPPEPSEKVLTEDDLIASILITSQQSAIDDLGEIVEQYVQDEKIKAMANRICCRIEGLYQRHGIANPFESDRDGV
ncbi:MAG: hypothetical protein V6Z81_06450 [Parvularculales bacterium]